jgi:hypothetical protein
VTVLLAKVNCSVPCENDAALGLSIFNLLFIISELTLGPKDWQLGQPVLGADGVCSAK